MECKDFTHDLLLDHAERLLSERLLDPRIRQAVDEHLTACPPCRDRFDEVKKIAGAIRKTLQAPPHEALARQLESSVLGQFDAFHAGNRRGTTRGRIYWAFGVAAAAAVLVAVIVGVTWSGPAQQPSNDSAKKPAPESVIVKTPTPSAPDVPEPAPEQRPPKTEIVGPEAPKPEPEKPTPQPPPRVVKEETPKPEQPKIELPKAPVIVKGDLNNDGKLNLQDANYLDQEILAGRIFDPASADLNGDLRVDCGDVLAIIQASERNP